MTDEDSNIFEDIPACPNCGSTTVERTPILESEYQCIDCGTKFDEGGRAG